jgi:TrmH family RNA methyltransferase
VEPIRSADNPKIKELRALLQDAGARRTSGLWVAEGVRLAEEAASSGLEIVRVFVSDDWEGERKEALLARLSSCDAEIVWVKRGILREISDTRQPQGIAVVLRAPMWNWAELSSRSGPVLVLDRLQDPGNVGTLARSLAAAGGAGLVLAPETADPGNPKALRASAGALFRLPVVRSESLAEARKTLACSFYTTAGRGGRAPEDLPLDEKFALVLGQEGLGVGRGWSEGVDGIVTIPMETGVESLNVATAGGVILFEAARQRRASLR